MLLQASLSGEGNEVVLLEMQSDSDPCLPCICSHLTTLSCWVKVQRLACWRVFRLSFSLCSDMAWRASTYQHRPAERLKKITFFHFLSYICTSYSCTQYALSVGYWKKVWVRYMSCKLTPLDVGVQLCPGEGWLILEGCGSSWHLHS